MPPHLMRLWQPPNRDSGVKTASPAKVTHGLAGPQNTMSTQQTQKHHVDYAIRADSTAKLHCAFTDQICIDSKDSRGTLYKK